MSEAPLPRNIIPPLPIVQALGYYPILLLMDVHQAMRGISGVRISSWYRTRASNAAAGGDPLSQHLVACAIDVAGVAPGIPPSDVAMEAIRQRLRFASVGVIERDPTHLHVQIFPRGALDAQVRKLAQ